ncbi:MAG: alpha/beta hydrolase [Phycisphaerae bacterium]
MSKDASAEQLTDGRALELWPDGAPGAVGDGAEDRPMLMPILPEGEPDGRAVIVCPGGGYNHLAEHEGEPVARLLSRWGFTAFVLQYRVKPYMFDAALADARRAMRTVRAHAPHWNLNPQQVGMMGFSAGGHLTAGVSIIDEPAADPVDQIDTVAARPDFAVLCYAPVSLPAMGRGDRYQWLLGERPSESLLRYIELDRRVTDRTPPTFLWHTAEDTVVPVDQSLLLASALSKADVPFELHVFAKGHHGLGLAEGFGQVQRWTVLLRAWLENLEIED